MDINNKTKKIDFRVSEKFLIKIKEKLKKTRECKNISSLSRKLLRNWLKEKKKEKENGNL